MIPTCAVCESRLVAQRSQQLGVCASCATLAGRTRYGDLQHTPTCPGPRIVRFDGTRFAQLTCQACAATAVVPRRTEWTEEVSQ